MFYIGRRTARAHHGENRALRLATGRCGDVSFPILDSEYRQAEVLPRTVRLVTLILLQALEHDSVRHKPLHEALAWKRLAERKCLHGAARSTMRESYKSDHARDRHEKEAGRRRTWPLVYFQTRHKVS